MEKWIREAVDTVLPLLHVLTEGTESQAKEKTIREMEKLRDNA